MTPGEQNAFVPLLSTPVFIHVLWDSVTDLGDPVFYSSNAVTTTAETTTLAPQ